MSVSRYLFSQSGMTWQLKGKMEVKTGPGAVRELHWIVRNAFQNPCLSAEDHRHHCNLAIKFQHQKFARTLRQSRRVRVSNRTLAAMSKRALGILAVKR